MKVGAVDPGIDGVYAPLMVEIRLLEYLATTAEAGSIGAAARRLHVAQPTLSHQIRRLERETGLTLFHRHHAGVSLTDDGVAVLAAARDVIDAHHRLGLVVADRQQGRVDSITLGLVENVPAVSLTTLLAELRGRITEVRIETTMQSTPDNVAAVRSALIDAAVVRGPVDLDRALRQTTIAHHEIGVLLTVDDPLAAMDVIPGTALVDRALITFPREWAPDAYDTHKAALAAVGVDLDRATPSYNVAQTAGFVTAGLGAAFVSRDWFTDAASAVWRPLADVELVTTFAVITRNASRLPRLLRAIHAAAESSAAVAD